MQQRSFPLRNNLVTNISAAIDEHLKLLGSGCPITNQSQTGYLNINQVLTQYLTQSSNPVFNSMLDHSNYNLNNTYPTHLQLVPQQHIHTDINTTQSSSIIYHSIEDCIIDENNLFGNINVLNADETKQTKILVMPTVLYGKYLQPVLDRIKESLIQNEHGLTCTDISLANEPTMSLGVSDQKEDMIRTVDSDMSESEEEDDDKRINQLDKSSAIESSIIPKNSNNNYSKISNKKGIKKKRKYIKSGLFRKDRNGHFLFSSADRSRLASLIDTTHGSINPGSEVLESSDSNNTHSTVSSSPVNPSNVSAEVVEEDRLGFELYCRETVPLHRDAASNSLLLREQWKALMQDERDRYLKRSVVMGVAQLGDLSNSELFLQLDDEFSEIIKDNNGKYSRVKRPLNAYNIFCKVHFPEFQEQYPDLTINQISKFIGEKWKSLSNDEKQPYIEKSKNSTPVLKKPLNAYNIFCKIHFLEFQQQHPNLTINQISKKVAEAWKSLSEEEKNSYKSRK